MKCFRLLPLLFLFLSSVLPAAEAQEKSAAPAPAAKKPVAEPVFTDVIFRPLLRAKQDPAAFADPVHAAELFQAREKLIQDLLSERRRILTTDPKARELHARILELNKQLAVVLESKRAVRELTRDLMLVDSRIDSLERKAPEKPVPAPAKVAPAAPAKK